MYDPPGWSRPPTSSSSKNWSAYLRYSSVVPAVMSLVATTSGEAGAGGSRERSASRKTGRQAEARRSADELDQRRPAAREPGTHSQARTWRWPWRHLRGEEREDADELEGQPTLPAARRFAAPPAGPPAKRHAPFRCLLRTPVREGCGLKSGLVGQRPSAAKERQRGGEGRAHLLVACSRSRAGGGNSRLGGRRPAKVGSGRTSLLGGSTSSRQQAGRRTDHALGFVLARGLVMYKKEGVVVAVRERAARSRTAQAASELSLRPICPFVRTPSRQRRRRPEGANAGWQGRLAGGSQGRGSRLLKVMKRS